MSDRRPRVSGKYLYAEGLKLPVRGVTYGTFESAADEEDNGFPPPGVVDQDFRTMSTRKINAVRTYTKPPTWLLDTAQRYGLRVMVGLPWEQHVTFLDDRRRTQDIRRRISDGVSECGGHPAILCYAIGNEIPGPVVRWHGRKRIEAFLEAVCDDARGEDPDGLFTYVNFPTTEFLELPFLDLLAFNVYLEEKHDLERYLERLQNLAGDLPVLMAEVGLDSRRHGAERQAEVLAWQVRSSFQAGSAGVFVFAWTDEWWRGGKEVEDWDFGLTTRAREPKPALAMVEKAFSAPLEPERDPPRISVVVCTYNGASTVDETLTHLLDLRYPDYEILVVNDGSEETTARLLNRFGCQSGVRIVHTPNRGLSAARNTGWREADGEIIAYLDDDAFPDRDWLMHLAITFGKGDWAGVGGPNVVPPEDGLVAQAVARSPGGPMHVLIDDRRAEHVPGCNMAFRRDDLERVGGFDTRYRVAGDDVDLCWRIRESGKTIGFSHGAMVWHHRRGSILRYWKQQVGYGKAEALLEEKWPHKYNDWGHVSWSGRIYGTGLTQALLRGPGRRIYQGTWGTAPFQSLYERAPGLAFSLPLTPEWSFVVLSLVLLTIMGFLWAPLVMAFPLLICAVGLWLVQGLITALGVSVPHKFKRRRLQRWVFRSLVAFFHLLQPIARLRGRLKHGLTPWRQRCPPRWLWPTVREWSVWSETWRTIDEWLDPPLRRLQEDKVRVRPGGEFDRWDLEVRVGLLGAARLLLAVEEHGDGKQMGRFRIWPSLRRGVLYFGIPAWFLTLVVLIDKAWFLGGSLAAVLVSLLALTIHESGMAQAALHRVVEWHVSGREEATLSFREPSPDAGEKEPASAPSYRVATKESLEERAMLGGRE